LKSGKLGGACLDVYELEESKFDHDFSGEVMTNDMLARLLTFYNVLITSHKGFLTSEVLKDIADMTLSSLTAFEQHESLVNEIKPQS
jgi:D-lactate dehydrogenase